MSPDEVYSIADAIHTIQYGGDVMPLKDETAKGYTMAGETMKELQSLQSKVIGAQKSLQSVLEEIARVLGNVTEMKGIFGAANGKASNMKTQFEVLEQGVRDIAGGKRSAQAGQLMGTTKKGE